VPGAVTRISAITRPRFADGDWILFLDADERPDEELAAALNSFKASPYPSEQRFRAFLQGVFLWPILAAWRIFSGDGT
jgi:glycosyltransferase involved in cell wall biosynthesis